MQYSTRGQTFERFAVHGHVNVHVSKSCVLELSVWFTADWYPALSVTDSANGMV